ncbi:HD domain-containing protein [Paucihalobacter sp.]|uniref:HD domain-containing protein n=1 Tax=Paucihalobacter sp. TaxID=2850405 RepID=UPI003D161F65
MNLQKTYQETIKFATLKFVEKNLNIPDSNLPYVVHLSNVAMEILIAAQHSNNFDVNYAIQLALLHDNIEDTDTTHQELEAVFGREVADGVLALTKNDALPKSEQLIDSLHRIQQQPKEVWAVKLADRITNLQQPPKSWSQEKIQVYKDEAKLILEQLKGGNSYLENRLAEMIEVYSQYITS